MKKSRAAPNFILSRSAEYALRAVLYVAQNAEQGRRVSTDAMAEALDLPRNYLSKVLHTLVRTGVLASERGPAGGFQLAVPATELALEDVVVPFQEQGRRRVCLLERHSCNDEEACPAHARWRQLSDHVAEFFRITTIASLLSSEDPGGAEPLFSVLQSGGRT